jgi:hypothetical protein
VAGKRQSASPGKFNFCSCPFFLSKSTAVATFVSNCGCYTCYTNLLILGKQSQMLCSAHKLTYTHTVYCLLVLYFVVHAPCRSALPVALGSQCVSCRAAEPMSSWNVLHITPQRWHSQQHRRLVLPQQQPLLLLLLVLVVVLVLVKIA